MDNMGPHSRMNSIIYLNTQDEHQCEIFFSHYAHDSKKECFANQLKLCGMAYRLDIPSPDSVDTRESLRLMTEKLEWHNIKDVHLDETCRSFLRQYWNNVIMVAENLATDGLTQEATDLLDKTENEIPSNCLQDLNVRYRIAKAYLAAENKGTHDTLIAQLRHDLNEQLSYYSTMSPTMQSYISYSLQPLFELQKILR